jgi:ligand-binding sensor domain-containing protein
MPLKTTAQWYEDGLSLLDAGFFDSAVECFDRVLQDEPDNAKVWMLRATALSRAEQYEQALECLDKTLEISPENGQVWQMKALCLSRLGRESEASDCQRRAWSAAEDAEYVPGGEGEPASRIYRAEHGLLGDAVSIVAADEEEAWFAYEEAEGVTRLTLSDMRFQSYNENDGLVSNDVRCIHLTEKGAWLGTDRGVSRFDKETQRWTSHTHESGLRAQAINGLTLEEELLWLATDSGLVVLDPRSGRSVLCRGGPDPVEIDYLVGDGNLIWCGSSRETGGLWVFDKSAETFSRLDVGPGVQGMQLFARGDSQKLWVARADSITIVDRTTHHTEVLPLQSMVVTDIAAGVNNLLLGTDRGLAIVDCGEDQVVATMSSAARGQHVRSVCGTRTRVWMALDEQGVLCLDYS